MPDSEYSRRLAAALQSESPEASVQQMKDVVTDELQHLDRRVRVVETPYFNHSYSPDLVMTWPHAGAEAHRPVFLRFDSNPVHLSEDIQIIGNRKPIIFEIDDAGVNDSVDSEPSTSRADELLSTLARQNRAMLTDADGLGTFISRRESSPIVGLAASAMVQGGVGLVREQAADRFADVVSEGFVGAQNLDADPTLLATAVFSEMMADVHAQRMTRFLQAVWLGAGGRADEFPAPVELGSQLTDQGIEFLVEADEIDDAAFWRSIGRTLSTDQLGRLRGLLTPAKARSYANSRPAHEVSKIRLVCVPGFNVT